MVIQGIPIDGVEDVRSLNVAPNFSMRAVDGLRGDAPTDRSKEGHNQAFLMKSDPPPLLLQNISSHPDDDPVLGNVLSKFVGTFSSIEGAGMNMIFRPNFGFKDDLLSDNLLEINLTFETLQFMQSSILAKVPNRGFDNQDLVNVTGIPYMQTVNDKLNENTGKMDNKEIGIHFEQGLFLLTPASTSPNTNGLKTISRLASIPHGTTINLQDTEPTKPISGPPKIPSVDITPFNVRVPDPKTKQLPPRTPGPQFANMNTTDTLSDKVRKPPNIKNVLDNNKMGLTHIKNPNQFLTDFFLTNDKKKIDNNKTVVEHWIFTVTSQHKTLGGGGVANIAFLADGAKRENMVNGNANASAVECTYWVSKVKYKVEVPAKDYTNKDETFTPIGDVDNVPGPCFKLQIGRKINQTSTIELTAPIIQYSQNVTLDFGFLSWPHVSVATLAPALPIFISQDDPMLKGLK